MVSGRKASFSSVERREIPRLFPHSFLLPILKTGTILESLRSCFFFPDLQSQFLRARGEFYTSMFSDFRRYATPSSRCFTFLCCIDCIQHFLEFMFFIKTCNVWPLRNGVQGRATSYSCYILSWSKWFANLPKTHFSPAGLSHHQRHQAGFWETAHLPLPLS